jgi:Icc-related predicted phosphoesterase
MSIKIACISDTHMWGMPLKELPEADILLHAGDATYRGTIEEVSLFAKEISKHLKDSRYKPAYKKIIFVPGNHDWLFERDEALARQIMQDAGVEVLINEAVEFDGFKIWGSPVTPPFHNWAFNWEPNKRIHLWEQIPEDTDIVITHGPPLYILDEVPEYDKIRHTGCPHLANRLRVVKPKMHLFGHIHESYGVIVKNETKYVNASIMDRRYNPNNKATLVEL